MKKHSIKENYFFNLSYQILQIIIPIITVPYVSRILLVEGIGIQSFVASIVSYFTLFGSLGLGIYGQREIAYYQNDQVKRTKIFWELFLLKLITISICLTFYFFIIRNFSSNYKIFLIYSLEIISCALDIGWYYQGLELFGKLLIRNFLARLITTVLIFILIKNESDLYKYVILITSGSYFVNITLIPSLCKTLTKIKLKSLNLLQHLRPILFLFIPQIAINIYTVLDKSMIGFLTHSNIENGYYEQAIKIIKLSLTIITSLGVVMAPRISNLYSNQKFEEIKERLQSSFKFVFFLGLPMLFGLIGISDIFVPIFFGPGYAKSILLIKILSGLFIAIGLNSMTGSQFLIPLKKEKIFTLSVISGAVVNFTLNIFLIQKIQSVGAAISSVIAESLITFIQFFYIRKIIQLKKIFSLTYHYIISSVIMYLVLIILKNVLRISILNLIIMIAGCSSLYFLLLILFHDNFVFTLINIILKRLKTKTAIKHI